MQPRKRPDNIYSDKPVERPSFNDRMQVARAKRAAREAIAAKILAVPKRKR